MARCPPLPLNMPFVVSALLCNVTIICSTVIHACDVRGYADLKQYLLTEQSTVLTHKDCRRDFTDLRKYKKPRLGDDPNILAHAQPLRSKSETFKWK